MRKSKSTYFVAILALNIVCHPPVAHAGIKDFYKKIKSALGYSTVRILPADSVPSVSDSVHGNKLENVKDSLLLAKSRKPIPQESEHGSTDGTPRFRFSDDATERLSPPLEISEELSAEPSGDETTRSSTTRSSGESDRGTTRGSEHAGQAGLIDAFDENDEDAPASLDFFEMFKPAKPLAPSRDKAKVVKCCSSISSGLPSVRKDGETELQPFTDDRDPYFSGDSEESVRSWNFGYVDSQKDFYRYYPPTQLGHGNEVAKDIFLAIPTDGFNPAKENSAQGNSAYYFKRLRGALTSKMIKYSGKFRVQHQRDIEIRDIATLAGRGSQSWVFFIHEPMNAASALEVVKIRNPYPFGDIHDPRLAARMMRRDLTLGPIFAECARGFKIVENGWEERLIEVVEYHQSEEEVSRGILRQRAVHGPSVFEVANMIERADRALRSGNRDEHTNISRIFRKWNFKSIENAKKRINALEAFYRLTHNDVRNFLKSNNLDDDIANRTFKKTGAHVGFDYNHGLNVIWDVEDKIFKAIDR